MCQSVVTFHVVGTVDAHGLLAHRTLLHVPGRLVVVREWDDAGAHAQDHAGMYLAVRLGVAVLVGLEVVQTHGNHGVLFLFYVHILDAAVLHEVVEVQQLVVLDIQLELQLLLVVVQLQAPDVPLADKQGLAAIVVGVAYHEQWAHHAPVVQLDP